MGVPPLPASTNQTWRHHGRTAKARHSVCGNSALSAQTAGLDGAGQADDGEAALGGQGDRGGGVHPGENRPALACGEGLRAAAVSGRWSLTGGPTIHSVITSQFASQGTRVTQNLQSPYEFIVSQQGST